MVHLSAHRMVPLRHVRFFVIGKLRENGCHSAMFIRLGYFQKGNKRFKKCSHKSAK